MEAEITQTSEGNLALDGVIKTQRVAYEICSLINTAFKAGCRVDLTIYVTKEKPEALVEPSSQLMLAGVNLDGGDDGP